MYIFLLIVLLDTFEEKNRTYFEFSPTKRNANNQIQKDFLSLLGMKDEDETSLLLNC